MWRKRSRKSYRFSRRYLQRKPSNMVTPDTSRATFRFGSRDLLRRRPRPRSRGSSVPVQAWKAGAPQVNPVLPTGALATNPTSLEVSDEPRQTMDSLGTSKPPNLAKSSNRDGWKKVSLPEREQTPAPTSDSGLLNEPQRERGSQLKTNQRDSLSNITSRGSPQRANMRNLPQTPPQAVSRADENRKQSPTSAKAQVRPRSWRVGPFVPRDTKEPEIVDLQEALDFVDAWGTYLRRAVAHRAMLRKQRASWEQEQEQRWSYARSWSSLSSLPSSRESDTGTEGSSSYYSVPGEDKRSDSNEKEGSQSEETSSSGPKYPDSVEASLQDAAKRYSALFQTDSGFDESPWLPEASEQVSDLEEVTPLRPKPRKIPSTKERDLEVYTKSASTGQSDKQENSLENKEHEFLELERRESSESIQPTPELYELASTNLPETEQGTHRQDLLRITSNATSSVSRQGSFAETDAELLRFQRSEGDRQEQAKADEDMLLAKQTTLQTTWAHSSDNEETY